MKRKVNISIFVIIFSIICYSIFFNGFFGVNSIEIQESDKSYNAGIKTTDKKQIAEIMGILNRANKITFTKYKIAGKSKYKIQLEYRDKTKENLHFYENFGKNTTLITSNKCSCYYKINSRQTKKIFQLLLN
ncbi:hypothetical protein DFR59_102302 [Falsibacillus pallidus]|uniref:YhfM-like domain-containing protein n=1 Tax=Falsibacillus pallidus TaxID=493781 RepID=A0A370GQS7_9BACI|nr:hypothetical protein DFR59_102302 [Falsibacillus pallidus]